MLLVEDLMLLLLDDETGTPAAAGTLPYALGGAVLVELALLGRVETDGKKVSAIGDGPLSDQQETAGWIERRRSEAARSACERRRPASCASCSPSAG